MGKTQLATDVKKPAAGFISKTTVETSEDVAEIAEQIEAIEKVRTRESARATKVSKFLGDNYFRTDKTWPFLFWPAFKMQLSVRYFFPNKNLAIDQFRSPTKIDMAAVDFKRKVLAEKGIKYFPMFPQNKMMELADYL